MARGVTQQTVAVEGLTEMLRSFGKLSTGLRLEVIGGIRRVAEDVASEARTIAEGKGLRESGALISGIRAFSTNTGAGVRESTKRDGFLYPAIYEFGHGRVRAFLIPALEKKADHVQRAVDEVLGRLVGESGFTGS